MNDKVKSETAENRLQIQWSYPTSPNAVKMGFGKTGCWTLESVLFLNGTPQPPKAIKGFREKAEAEFYMMRFPNPLAINGHL